MPYSFHYSFILKSVMAIEYYMFTVSILRNRNIDLTYFLALSFSADIIGERKMYADFS